MKNLFQGTSIAGAVLAALVPFAKCPVCAAAAAGVLGSLGIAGLGLNPWFVPVLGLFLALGLWGFVQSARAHGSWLPLSVATMGSAGVLVSRLLEQPSFLWLGGLALLGAFCLDLRAKRRAA